MNHSEKCGSCKHEIYQCAAGKFLFSGRFIVNKQRKPGCLNTIYNKQTIEALVHAEFPFLHARFFLSEYHSFESGVSVVSKLNLQGTQYRDDWTILQWDFSFASFFALFNACSSVVSRFSSGNSDGFVYRRV